MSALATNPDIFAKPSAGLEAALRGSLERLATKKKREAHRPTRKWALSAMVYDIITGNDVRGHTLAMVLAQELDYARLVPFLVESHFARGEALEKLSNELNDYIAELARRYFEAPAQKDVVEAYRRFDLLRGMSK